jgi:hypothetical protein
LPFHTDFLNGAKSQIADLVRADNEKIAVRKGLKIAKIIKFIP